MRKSEQTIKNSIATRSHTSNPKKSTAGREEVNYGPSFHTESGAMVTYQNAGSVLNEYWASLHSELILSPKYALAEDNRGFAYEIYFPSRYHRRYQRIRGSLKPSAKEAKGDVSLKAVKLLYASGEIDDFLKPRNILLGGAERRQAKQRLLTASRKGGKWYDFAVPTALIEDPEIISDSRKLYLHVLHFECEERKSFGTVGLTTPHHTGKAYEIPFNFLIANEMNLISVVSLDNYIPMSDNLQKKLQKFTLEFFKSVLRSPIPEDGQWLMNCFPINVENINSITKESDPASIIDWKALEHCENSPRDIGILELVKNGDIQSIQEFCYIDLCRYKRVFLIDSITEKTPMSLSHSDAKNASKIIEVYSSAFSALGKNVDDVLLDQNLVFGTHLGYPYGSTSKLQNNFQADLIPQKLITSGIYSRHVVEARRMPLLIRHFHHRLLVQDLLDKKPFPDRPGFLNTTTDLLQTAFTSPVSSMAFSYERMETLGDSFLKASLTLHLFVKRVWQSEGSLTKEKQILESNANLRFIASQLNLEGYVLSSTFSRKTFIPAAKGAIHKQKMTDKMVADLVEASIGACFVHGGETAASESCVFFFGTDFKASFQEYHALYSNSINASGYQLAVRVRDSYAEVEDLFGYKFKTPAIIEEALTHPTAFPGTLKSYERLEFIGILIF